MCNNHKKRISLQCSRNWYLALAIFLCVLLLLILLCPFIRRMHIGIAEKLVLMVGGNTHIFFKKADHDAQFFGNAIWVLTTILSATAIFFYSFLNNFHYGFSLRELICIQYGRFLIPTLLVLSFLAVLLMMFAYYLGSIALYYSLIVYSILTQTILIVLFLILVSEPKARKIIKKHYTDHDNKALWTYKEDTSSIGSNKFSVRHILSGSEPVYDKLTFAVELIFESFSLCTRSWKNDWPKISYCELFKECTYIGEYIAALPNNFTPSQAFFENIYNNYRSIKDNLRTSPEDAVVWIIPFGGIVQPILATQSLPGRWEMLGSLIHNCEDNETRRDYLILTVLMSMFFLLKVGAIQDTAEFQKALKRNARRLLGDAPDQTMEIICQRSCFSNDKRFNATHISQVLDVWLANVDLSVDKNKRLSWASDILHLLRGDSAGSGENIPALLLSEYLHSFREKGGN